MDDLSTRRRLIKFLGAMFLMWGRSVRARPQTNDGYPIMGAIRWDAWYDPDGGIGHAVDESLGPNQFHDRIPFFGQEIASDEVRIDGNSQATVDKEILYADNLGLDYWAYCWYDDIASFQRAWTLHQSSEHADKMNWCMLWQLSHLGGPDQFKTNTPNYVKWFSMTNYQKVDGAPLVYLLHNGSSFSKQWSNSIEKLSGALSDLSAACSEAGLRSPNIVLMNSDPSQAAAMLRDMNAFAISGYIAWIPNKLPAPFAELTAFNRMFWDKMATTGAPIVPIVMTGWDPRPRELHPPPWESHPPQEHENRFVEPATNEEIDSAIRLAERYIEHHPTQCPSKLLLIYSWNECDEGGGALVSKSYLATKHQLRPQFLK